jgi:hypothetical protein
VVPTPRPRVEHSSFNAFALTTASEDLDTLNGSERATHLPMRFQDGRGCAWPGPRRSWRGHRIEGRGVPQRTSRRPRHCHTRTQGVVRISRTPAEVNVECTQRRGGPGI